MVAPQTGSNSPARPSGLKEVRSVPGIFSHLIIGIVCFMAGRASSGSPVATMGNAVVTGGTTAPLATASTPVTVADTAAAPRALDNVDPNFPYDIKCLQALPEWVLSDKPDIMSDIFRSVPATDKSTSHKYQHMYHRYFSKLALRTCHTNHNNKIRVLEIGLGCGRRAGTGMLGGQPPGGSSEAWRKLFPSPTFQFDLHVMEFDAPCALNWTRDHPGRATVHPGDASNTTDLDRIYQEAGGLPFDVIIDDASHLNEHQIITFQHMIQYVNQGGVFIIEDIHSSCLAWRANTGSLTRGMNVQGTQGCMETKDGKPTIYAKLVEWGKPLVLGKRPPFPNVTHIDINYEAAVIEKMLA